MQEKIEKGCGIRRSLVNNNICEELLLPAANTGRKQLFKQILKTAISVK